MKLPESGHSRLKFKEEREGEDFHSKPDSLVNILHSVRRVYFCIASSSYAQRIYRMYFRQAGRVTMAYPD